jgi:response regulator NasT
VAKAKAILMEKYGMSEPEAYRSLQKTSMDSGVPIREIAQTVIDTNGKEFYRYW